MKKLARYTPLIILFSITAIIWLTGIYEHINLITLYEKQEFLQDYIDRHKNLSIALFSFLYFIIISFSIPVATILSITGGFLFGKLIGTICVVIAASLGGCSIFLSVKLASKPIKQNDKTKLNKIKSYFKQNAFLCMICLRIIPIFPFVIVNIIAGTLQISLKSFFFGTLIGIIPINYIYVSIGVAMQDMLKQQKFSIASLLSKDIIIAICLLGIITFLSIVYYNLNKRQK